MKTPEVKAPKFVSDLYYDLRDRRLLPLVALLLVAILATPFLLSQGSEPEVPPAASAAIQALKEEGGPREASLVVVESRPGLRDYRRRLRNRTPLDPFRKVGRPSLKGAKLGNGEGGGGGSSTSESTTSTSTTLKETTTKTGDSTKTTTSETTTTTTGDGKDTGGAKAGGGSGGSDKGGSGKGGNAQPQSYTIDIQISKPGASEARAKPQTRNDVQPQTPLPGKKKPVLTYLGRGLTPGRALFSISRDVTAIFGEAKCVSGTELCEVVELEPDFPVTFVYGDLGTRYKIKLLKLQGQNFSK